MKLKWVQPQLFLSRGFGAAFKDCVNNANCFRQDRHFIK